MKVISKNYFYFSFLVRKVRAKQTEHLKLTFWSDQKRGGGQQASYGAPFNFLKKFLSYSYHRVVTHFSHTFFSIILNELKYKKMFFFFNDCSSSIKDQNIHFAEHL